MINDTVRRVVVKVVDDIKDVDHIVQVHQDLEAVHLIHLEVVEVEIQVEVEKDLKIHLNEDHQDLIHHREENIANHVVVLIVRDLEIDHRKENHRIKKIIKSSVIKNIIDDKFKLEHLFILTRIF